MVPVVLLKVVPVVPVVAVEAVDLHCRSLRFFLSLFFTVILYKSRGELSISVQYMPDIPGGQSMIK